MHYSRKLFERDFPTDEACLQRIMEMRFPGNMARCDSETCGGVLRKHHQVSGRTAYACHCCGRHLYPLVGTVFERSSTSLLTWFRAMYLVGIIGPHISAKQIQRETGVTYKTAWRMLRLIRTLPRRGRSILIRRLRRSRRSSRPRSRLRKRNR